MSGTNGGSANGTAKNAAANAANNGADNTALNGAGIVRNADITQEMQVAYLDYAMSVIVARALPDVRDGLKPVHRRILYAMWHDLSLTYDKPHKKSARIVGEVLGKYHPHGDAAVYDAMVRMAQDFSLRYPLIDGQGNFGSIDGDNAAAMRYTEARLARITNLMLEDLEKDTVGWHPNFDNTLREPDILPAALPNLLINGSSGIAVGMATNIPPHNLGEVVDALVYVIDRFDQVEEITTEQLMQFIKGPDFPTGGIIYRFREEGKGEDDADAIAQGYSLGKSRLVVQAKAHFEEISRGRTRIIVTELPYQTNKTALLERIADLVRDGKIEGISDLRDESDRTGMRIVVELSRTIEPKDVLASLYKYTPLQQTFGMQLLALADGQPRLLSLKRMLQLFVQHRQEIIRRRSEYDLKQARDRAHIVEGLLRALDILDEVIHTIRHSQTVDTARKNLIANFQFTEPQAQAILDMQLRRLAALERKKLQEEYADLKKRIAYLEDLLAHPHKILGVIKDELLAIRQEYADARRTQIVDRTRGALTTHDLLPDQTVWVSVSKSGDVRRVPAINRTGIAALRQVGKDSQLALLTANTRDLLYVFTRDGRCGRTDVHHLPADDTSRSIADLIGFRANGVAAVAALPRGRSGPEAGYFFFVTEKGAVKRVSVADVQANTATEFSIFNVEDGDKLAWALHTPGDKEVILVSAEGQSIRFAEDEVRSMGLAAGGVGGMKLRPKDRIVFAGVVDPDGELVTVSAAGFAKRTALSEYSSQGRNGGGILAHKLVERTGRLEAGLVLPARTERDTVILVSNKGVAKPLPVSEIARMGRSASGKQLITLAEKDVVTAAWLIASGAPSSPDEDEGGGDAGGAKPDGKAKETAPRRSAKADVPAEQVELLGEVVERAQAAPPHVEAPRAAKTAPVAAAPLPLTRAPATEKEKAKPLAAAKQAEPVAKQAEPVAKQAEAGKGPKQAPAEPQAAAPAVEAPKGKAKATAEQATPAAAKPVETKQPEPKQAAAKQAEAKPAVKQADAKAAKVADTPAATKAEPKPEPKAEPKVEPKSAAKAEAKPAAEPSKGKAQAKPVDVPVVPVKAAEPADAKAKPKVEQAEKSATPALVEAKAKQAPPAPAKKQEPVVTAKPQPSEVKPAKPAKAVAQKPEPVKIEPEKIEPAKPKPGKAGAKPTPAEIAAGSRGRTAPKTAPGTVTIPFEFAQEKEPAKGAKPANAKAGAGKLDAVVSVTKSQAKKKKAE